MNPLNHNKPWNRGQDRKLLHAIRQRRYTNAYQYAAMMGRTQVSIRERLVRLCIQEGASRELLPFTIEGIIAYIQESSNGFTNRALKGQWGNLDEHTEQLENDMNPDGKNEADPEKNVSTDGKFYTVYVPNTHLAANPPRTREEATKYAEMYARKNPASTVYIMEAVEAVTLGVIQRTELK